MTFISDDIISENTLSANTSTITTINTSVLSATTLYGNGSNLTNISLTPSGPNSSIQFNNNGVVSGSTNLTYNGNTLTFSGTSRFDGLFYRTNSPSVKLTHQWGGTITAGITPGIVWTNMPAGLTTWLHTATGTLTQDATYITDLTEYSQCRLFTSAQVAGGAANSLIKVQYATTIAGVYSDLVSTTIDNTTGAKDSGWSGITSGANGVVFIRLVGQNGNGAADPRFSPPILLIR